MIDLTGIDNLVEAIDNKLNYFIITVAQELHAEVVKVLEDYNKKASGNLLESIIWEVKKIAESYFIEIYSKAPYAVNVYYGRKAGGRFPPIQKISEWVLQKGIATVEEAPRVSFLIARAIAVKGIESFKFFDIALTRYKPILKQRALEAGLIYR